MLIAHRGGMGIVLKAFDESLHRVVAVKVMAPQLATSATARQRFVREVQAAAAVRDEHVVDIYAVEEAKGLPFFVMEYIGGQSLQERLDRTGPLEVKEILRIGMQAARGLAAAHAQGLIHRDVKPANILLENGVQRVKITDFGLARAADDASLTQSGVVAGTPQYMAPEQAESRALDHRADLFSLGSVLYTMCTGRAPFRASSPMAVLKRVCDDTPRPVQEVNADIPDWLAGIVVRLHAKDPGRRYQSAAEVADVLSKHLAHYQQPDVPTVQPPASRKRRGWRLAAAAVLLGGLAFAAYWYGPVLSDYLKDRPKWMDRPVHVGTGALELPAKRFGSDDIIITKENVTHEDGAWRIDNKPVIDAGLPPTMVRLYELRGPFPDSGEITFHAKLKSQVGTVFNSEPFSPITAGLYMFFRSENLAVGTTEWADYEVRYPLNWLLQSDEPPVIPLSLCLWGKGSVWIKDMEVSYSGEEGRPQPDLLPGEELVRAFAPDDVPITKALTHEDPAVFSPARQEREGWWYTGAALFHPIRLYEIRDPALQGCELILRTKIKTAALVGGIYPSMSADTKGGGGIDSPKPDVFAKMDTNWTTYETRLEVPQGVKPVLVRINLVPVLEANQRGSAERAGFKDMIIVKAPLRSAAKDAGREPVKLKSFRPGDDTPLDKDIRVKDGAWQVEHTTANTTRHAHLFEIRDTVPEGGEIIYRAKVKTQPPSPDLWGSIMLGENYPYGELRADDKAQFRGRHSDWVELEARYPAHGFFHGKAPVIPVDLGFHGAGTVYIKDIEIWHEPPEPPLRRPGEVLFKRFGPKDKPISNDYRTSSTDGWEYQIGAGDRLIRLFEVQNPDLPDCRLVLRARIRTEAISANPHVRLQMTWRVPEGTPRVYTSEVAAEGNTKWSSYEIQLPLTPGYERPNVIELSVKASGTHTNLVYHFDIKDIELHKAPLK
jgi:hypothetical protein